MAHLSIPLAIDFTIRSCSRKCSVSDRALEPGEAYYSLLVEEGNDVVRQDIAAEAWQGPPEEHLGWWRSRIAGSKSKKPKLAPSEVLISLLDHWSEEADKTETRYVLALLMIRRRMLREESTSFAAGLNGEDVSDDKHQLRLYCQQNEKKYEVAIVKPTTERVSEIQNYLSDLLFADAA